MKSPLFPVLALTLGVWAGCSAQTVTRVTTNGTQPYQMIDGFGVNANHRSWTTNAELRPVLDALIDEAGMTLFRVVFDNTDWEAANDNPDPAVMNWTNYNAIYGSAKFQNS